MPTVRLAGAMSALAMASTLTVPGGAAATPASAVQVKTSISIAGGPLDMAILRLAEQTGLSIFVPRGLAAGKNARALQGTMAPEDALTRLLAGSGLTYTREADGSYIITRAPARRIAAAALAPAQDDIVAAPEAAASQTPDTGDIIVTAQRRSERLQDAPVTVTALEGETLRAAGIKDLTDLRTQTPGLYSGEYTFSRPQLYIRGIGTRQYDAGSEASVAVFQDDIYIARISNLNSDFFDVERVEVLKGPQGTLYGRNAAGGAIAVYTRNPTDRPEGSLSATVGNLGQIATNGAVSGPIAGDTLIGRIAFATNDRDGYLKNLATGRNQNGINSAQLRAKLLWKPTDRLEILLRGDYSHDDPVGVQGKNAGPGMFLSRPGMLASFTPDPRSDYYSSDSINQRKMGTGSLHFKYDGDAINVTAIAAYHEGRIRESRDVDSTAADVYLQDSDERSRQETLELRIASTPGGSASLDGKLIWQLGAFYLHDRTKRTELIIGGDDSFYTLFAGVSPFTTTAVADINTRSYALYGTATLALTDQLNVTVGARYTNDRKGATSSVDPQLPGIPGAAPAYYISYNDKTWDSFDPRITVDYHATSDLMLFATYSTGFKSGGFQYLARTASAAAVLINPEKVKYFEAGMKSQWFDRRLTLNAAAFHYNYKDLQLSTTVIVPGPGGGAQTLTTNAASSTIKGFEVEGRARPTDWLNLTYGYTYLDAKYDNYTGPGNVSYAGVQMVRTPKHSFNLGAQLHGDLGGGTNHTFRVDWSYYSSFNHEPDGAIDPAQREGAYHLVNLSETIETGPWQFTAWVRNVGNVLYRSTILQTPASPLFGAMRVDFFAPPRTYGLTVRRTF